MEASSSSPSSLEDLLLPTKQTLPRFHRSQDPRSQSLQRQVPLRRNPRHMISLTNIQAAHQKRETIYPQPISQVAIQNAAQCYPNAQCTRYKRKYTCRTRADPDLQVPLEPIQWQQEKPQHQNPTPCLSNRDVKPDDYQTEPRQDYDEVGGAPRVDTKVEGYKTGRTVSSADRVLPRKRCLKVEPSLQTSAHDPPGD